MFRTSFIWFSWPLLLWWRCVLGNETYQSYQKVTDFIRTVFIPEVTTLHTVFNESTYLHLELYAVMFLHGPIPPNLAVYNAYNGRIIEKTLNYFFYSFFRLNEGMALPRKGIVANDDPTCTASGYLSSKSLSERVSEKLWAVPTSFTSAMNYLKSLNLGLHLFVKEHPRLLLLFNDFINGWTNFSPLISCHLPDPSPHINNSGFQSLVPYFWQFFLHYCLNRLDAIPVVDCLPIEYVYWIVLVRMFRDSIHRFHYDILLHFFPFFCADPKFKDPEVVFLLRKFAFSSTPSNQCDELILTRKAYLYLCEVFCYMCAFSTDVRPSFQGLEGFGVCWDHYDYFEYMEFLRGRMHQQSHHYFSSDFTSVQPFDLSLDISRRIMQRISTKLVVEKPDFVVLSFKNNKTLIGKDICRSLLTYMTALVNHDPAVAVLHFHFLSPMRRSIWTFDWTDVTQSGHFAPLFEQFHLLYEKYELIQVFSPAHAFQEFVVFLVFQRQKLCPNRMLPVFVHFLYLKLFLNRPWTDMQYKFMETIEDLGGKHANGESIYAGWTKFFKYLIAEKDIPFLGTIQECEEFTKKLKNLQATKFYAFIYSMIQQWV